MQKIEILFEDEDILVIDKPSGVVTNRAITVKTYTLQDWMADEILKYNRESDPIFKDRCGMVHRLDKETSGVMIFAKNAKSMYELMRQFKDREIKKTYLALTHGYWKIERGIINLPVGRLRKDRKKFGVREDGKVAVTRYEVLGSYKHYDFDREMSVDVRGYAGISKVRFSPKTGRTHQIRIHSRAKGHPIVGDYLYAGKKRSVQDRKWAERIMLEAESIEFKHPTTNEVLKIVINNSKVNEVAERYLLR